MVAPVASTDTKFEPPLPLRRQPGDPRVDGGAIRGEHQLSPVPRHDLVVPVRRQGHQFPSGGRIDPVQVPARPPFPGRRLGRLVRQAQAGVGGAQVPLGALAAGDIAQQERHSPLQGQGAHLDPFVARQGPGGDELHRIASGHGASQLQLGCHTAQGRLEIPEADVRRGLCVHAKNGDRGGVSEAYPPIALADQQAFQIGGPDERGAQSRGEVAIRLTEAGPGRGVRRLTHTRSLRPPAAPSIDRHKTARPSSESRADTAAYVSRKGPAAKVVRGPQG